MNFANIKTLATSLYQLRTNSNQNEFGANDIDQSHFDYALGNSMKAYLGGGWYRNYRNRPELDTVKISSIEQYSIDTDYCKVTCDAQHYLTNEQDIILVASTNYDEIYKIFLIQDSATKTGYELDTFLFYDTFVATETPVFYDQIKKNLDFCTAILMVEKAAGFNRNAFQFDYNWKEYGKGNKRYSNWEDVAKRHAYFIRDVGKILDTFDNDKKDNTDLGYVELL